jgi:hypothetical protein
VARLQLASKGLYNTQTAASPGAEGLRADGAVSRGGGDGERGRVGRAGEDGNYGALASSFIPKEHFDAHQVGVCVCMVCVCVCMVCVCVW